MVSVYVPEIDGHLSSNFLLFGGGIFVPVQGFELGEAFLVGKLSQRVSKAKDAKTCRIYRDGEEKRIVHIPSYGR